MAMKVRVFLFLLLASSCLLRAEFRTFTNDFGDSVDAQLIELKEEGTIVEMRFRNGRKVDAALEAFSAKDQKYIRQWWKDKVAAEQVLTEEDRLVLAVTMGRRSSNALYDRWYADDKIKSFFPEVKIENEELQDFKGNEVRLVVFAEDMQYDGQILVVSAKTLKTDLKEREETVLESDPFRLRLYEYDSSFSVYDYKYGYEYDGYAIIIKNSKGEITHSKASKSKYLNPKLFFKCKAGEMYDDKFERKLSISPNSYFIR